MDWARAERYTARGFNSDIPQRWEPIPHAGSTQTFRDPGDLKSAFASASRINHHAV